MPTAQQVSEGLARETLRSARTPLVAPNWVDRAGAALRFSDRELKGFEGARESLKHDLVGNSFATTVFLAAAVALLQNWQRSGDA